MATLIAIYSGRDHRGRPICVGRCDAKCYQANHRGCDCICGGKNHGVGERLATEYTRDECDRWIADYARAKGLRTYTSELGQSVAQRTLFDLQTLSDFVLS